MAALLPTHARHHRHLALAAIVVTLASLVSPDAGATARAPVPIRHVVEIMLENHTFDDLFGHFPGAAGIAPDTALPSPSGSGTISPFIAPPNEGEVQGGLNNSRAAELAMMDETSGHYAMTGYTRFPGEGLSAITAFAPTVDPNLQYLARHYELADANFQPVVAPTLPNVLFALAGTAHGLVTNDEPPPARWSTIFDQLAARGLGAEMYSGVPASVYRGTVWPELLPKGHTVLALSSFFGALRRGALPAFSFVRPGVGYSEEPPEDVAEGDAWLGQLLAAIGASREWSSTAVFVTYDEGGGFWDGVAPPMGSGYGTRTPLLVVSPYARRGFFHAATTNVAILELLRTLFHLPTLDALEARQNDLLGAFNFSQPPLAPPRPPRAPRGTVAFYGTSALADPAPVAPGATATLSLAALGSALQPLVRSGTLAVAVTPPAGVTLPPSTPAHVALSRGSGTLRLAFPAAGYYRIALSGLGLRGYDTLEVGVTPNTP